MLVGKVADGTAELWITDGSGPGTRRLRSARGFSRLTAAGGGAVFVEHGPGGLFVGATDGTPAGTVGRLAVQVGDKLYFIGDDTERSGIWVIDLDQG